MYKPHHHHLERRNGSSTGGLSQIFFGGDADENLPPPPPTAGAVSMKSRGEFSSRNATSSVFDFSCPVPELTTGKAMVASSPRASTVRLGFDYDVAPEPDARLKPDEIRSNPIFGGHFESMSIRSQPQQLERPMTAPQRSARDPNRSSVDGGIFGAGPVPSHSTRRHLAIEEAPAARIGTKRMVGGRMEYCA